MSDLHKRLVAWRKANGHVFLIFYRRSQFVSAMRAAARFASDPALPFDFKDARELASDILADANRYADARECQGK